LKMFEEVMQSCAGLRRPGAAALDLCYVAAGWYDAFFETGLSPWDVAAGSLIVSEAGGLVGNFTGEADFLYRREVVAGNPRIYGQLVQLLAPYSRVIADTAEAGDAAAPAGGSAESARPSATETFVATAEAADTVEAAAPSALPPPPVKKAVRIRKAAAASAIAPDTAPGDAPF
jgi:myo-inositol-1(or 4)-monophosphatase